MNQHRICIAGSFRIKTCLGSFLLKAFMLMMAALLTCTFVATTSGQSAAPAVPGNPTDPVVILETLSAWRIYHTLSLPVIALDDALKPVLPTGNGGPQWAGVFSRPTSPPSAEWFQPDFDDARWLLSAANRACRTPLLDRLHLRGRFEVTNPQQVRNLLLSVDYHGGIVVYLNGREIKRQHLEIGAALAEPYPPEAFINSAGELLNLRGNDTRLANADADALAGMGLRRRSLSVSIPPSDLKPGMNIVAVELVRAPYHKVLDGLLVPHSYKSRDLTHDLSWNSCEILDLRLTADGAGLVTGAGRPEGIQVWNSDPMATDFTMDIGNPAEPLRPIYLVVARNGAVSGKVVVGSRSALRGLMGKVSELKSADGAVIPSSALAVRYATAFGRVPLTTEDNFEIVPHAGPVDPLLALLDVPLPEFPALDFAALPAAAAAASSRIAPTIYTAASGGAQSFSGAVVPVWVTVNVPAEARAAVYLGTLTIEVDGRHVADVPMELKVVDFLLPEPSDFRTWVELVQSPDTLAVQYGLELWSDRHFELIGRSLEYLRSVGSRVIYIPLVARTNFGNAETMVRWISKGDNAYEHDFSIMDRYLDLVEKHMDKPRYVVFMAWDLHLAVDGAGPRSQYAQRAVGRQPLVTVVLPGSGTSENIHLLPYEDPEGQQPWRKLFQQLRQRMAARGLEDTMLLGMASDIWPSKAQVEALKDISGDMPWSIAAHGSYYNQDKPLYGISHFGYSVHAFGTTFAFGRSSMGWKQPILHGGFERWGNIPNTPVGRWRSFLEIGITGNVRGMGRLGADFWPVELPGRAGRVTRGQVWMRYPEADLKQLSLKTSLLAPGPHGAVASQRYEALREGLQECEARIVIEAALADPESRKTLTDDLVEQCEQALLDRQRAIWRGLSPMQFGGATNHSFDAWRGLVGSVTGYTWFLGSNWQERTDTLYRLAGQVQRHMAQD